MTKTTKLSEFGIKEVWNLETVLLAFFGIRRVRFVNQYTKLEIAIVGVPPWRSLRSDDLYNKRCYELI